MPARSPLPQRVLALAAAAMLMSAGAFAQAPASAVPDDLPTHSALDSQLFQEILGSEIELRGGDPILAFQSMLDSARRTRDEQLYRRATDMALQTRSGDRALAAVAAWRQDLPESVEAHRYQIQLLVALNRAAETVEPMRSLVKIAPVGERPGIIMGLPRYFMRAADRKQMVGVLEQALQPYADAQATRVAVTVALGRAWLIAEDNARAVEMARKGHAFDPGAEGPALLALEMPAGVAGAEEVVQAHLQAKPNSDGIRMIYARQLTAAQRFGDAVQQLEAVTASQPKLAAPWLTLGALHLELRHPKQATAALERYVQLTQAATGPVRIADDEDEDAPTSSDRTLMQAWLLLAQAAEQQGDYKAAEAWLKRVDNPQRALEVMTRQASMLARQGKLREARELVRRAPEKTQDDARAKVLAETQLLRDAKQWGEAHKLLETANKRFADDIDLLYEQSMMAEKLNKLDDMERLLRRVIEIKPDHHHAYNALGYSLAERNLRLPEAKALIQKALEIAPGEPFITDSLGWVEYRIGNRAEALRLLRGAYQSRPDPEIAAHLGEVLWVSGQRDEARRIWREGHSKDSSNDVLRETLARLKVGDL